MTEDFNWFRDNGSDAYRGRSNYNFDYDNGGRHYESDTYRNTYLPNPQHKLPEWKQELIDMVDEEKAKECGFAEYYNVDRHRCEALTHPLDNVDRVSPQLSDSLSDDDIIQPDYEDEYEEIDPEEEFQAIEAELSMIEEDTKGMEFGKYVNFGFCCADWDREYELMLYVEEFGFRPHYTYDPRPE